MMLLLMMTMMAALTMFSMVSQWDLTCFLAAPNSNRSQEEKALKMMKDQSLSVSLELFPLPQTYDGEKNDEKLIHSLKSVRRQVLGHSA